jgi:hypothetical protein
MMVLALALAVRNIGLTGKIIDIGNPIIGITGATIGIGWQKGS